MKVSCEVRRLVLLVSIMCVLLCGCPKPNDREQAARPNSDSQVASPRIAAGGEEPAWFGERAAERGIDWSHTGGNADGYFFPEIMAGGCALMDFDLDGLLDIYVVNGNKRYRAPKAGGQDPEARQSNRLFRQTADGRFEDVTEAAGVGDLEFGMGAAVADVNQDGYPDLYVSNYGPDRLYLNQGDGSFRAFGEEVGLHNPRWGMSAVWLDYDRDGWLDLYVTNYVNYLPFSPCGTRSGVEDYCSPSAFAPTPDKLFRNLTGERGQLAFEDVSASSGIATKRGPGLGVVTLDANQDGWPDLYVANDGAANFLWINQQDGTFQEQALLLGCAYDQQGKPQAGMGIALADLTGNQRGEILVTHLDGESHALYVADDAGLFRDQSALFGVAAPSFPTTGFGTALADFDNDGDLDLVVANGRVTRPKLKPAPGGSFWSQYAEPNLVYENRGGRFEVRRSDDPFSMSMRIGRALCVGDLNQDGGLDMVVVNINDRLELFENRIPQRGHWLAVRPLASNEPPRIAYGTRVTCICQSKESTQVVQPNAGYLSSHAPELHFGLGTSTQVERLEVVWPDGQRERFQVEQVDRMVSIVRGTGESL